MRVDETCDVLVIGGGPSGCAAATAAARGGLRVVLLEAGAHPRMHVGESLLPGIFPILDELGVLPAMQSAGFATKTGSTHWNWGTTPSWDLWFADSDAYDHAWFVERARFDEIMFEHARASGVDARSHSPVRALLWDGDRLVGAEWRQRGEAEVRRTRAKLVIDASGEAALVARERDLRTPIPGLEHRAAFAHWRGCGRLPPPRSEQALFVARDHHWIWLFPMANGTTSIGVVGEDRTGARPDAYESLVRNDPQLAPLVEGAERTTEVISLRDWSYRNARVAGPGHLLCGDASGFIDPILSTGVFLALHAGALAGAAALRVLKDGASEVEIFAAYEKKHGELFSDLVRMVRFYYQRNLPNSAYFWESKRVLMSEDNALKPQKAFVILTSGLVRNLVYDERVEKVGARRLALVEGALTRSLGFVCAHLRVVSPGAPLYLLIEPTDLASPSLFRTKHFDLNCITPTLGKDPFSSPELQPFLERFRDLVRSLDAGERTISAFFSLSHAPLVAFLESEPERFELVRVFGE